MRTGASTWRSATSSTTLRMGPEMPPRQLRKGKLCSIFIVLKISPPLSRLLQCMGKNKNSKAALFTLTLLETCVKNCRREFRVLVCGREWAEELYQASLESPEAVRDQVLGLLQSWASAFSSDPVMAGVGELVAGLRARGVEFPEPSTQDIILTSSQVSQSVFPE